MNVEINYLAVLAAGIAAMILGALWYGPLFGKQWIAWSGMNQGGVDAAKQNGMTKAYVINFIAALVTAYVLSHLIVFSSSYMDVEGVSAGLSTGFWIWLGFLAPVTLGSVLWDGKPWKLWFLNNGYNLLNVLIMGAILAAWR